MPAFRQAKGVKNLMKYAKPVLWKVGLALDSVCGGKGMPVRNDSSYPYAFTATMNAYEADE